MRKLDGAVAEDLTTNVTDDLVTVEAPTVEQAMARLADEVGEDARIVSAEKVARGGLGGFFAKEMVVLTAHRPETDRRSLPGVLERLTERTEADEDLFGEVLRRELADHRPSPGLDNLLDAAGWNGSGSAGDPDAQDDATPLDADVAGAEAMHSEAPAAPTAAEPPPVTVGPMVSATPVPRPTTAMPEAPISTRIAHEHLVAMPPPTGGSGVLHVPGLDAAGITSAAAAVALTNPTPLEATESVSLGAPEVEATLPITELVNPDGSGAPRWAATELVRHGFPDRVVAAVNDLDSTDDLAWMSQLAAAVAPWCDVPPTGDQVIVGPGAERLAELLDLPLVRLGDVAPYAGSFCSELTGAEDDRAWLEFVRGDRNLHFVLGEDELWRDLLVADPATVSWISPGGLVDALYLASTLGATLGYGSLSAGDTMLRAQPVDVALGIRRIVGRQ